MLTFEQVQKLTGWDKQGIFAAIRDRGFPRASMRGPRIAGWPEGPVRAWIASHLVAA